MKRRLAAAALAFAALGLTGCGEAPSSAPGNTEQPSVARNLPVSGSDGLVMIKPLVEGTQLICVQAGYGSTSCNWELWNKIRATKK